MSRPRTESEYLASLLPPSVAAAGISRRGFLKGTLGTGAALSLSSLLAAYLIELAQFGILWLIAGRGNGAVVFGLALFGLVRLVISGMIGLVIVYAILSWVRADSPITDVIDRLCAPLLRPFRRMIPLVGGFDLSPLALLVVLQVAAIVVANVQDAVLR